MTVQVSFAGVNYDIPEEDDSGWADLTSYLVALSAASVGTVDTKAFRIATSTPVTVSAVDDYGIAVNVSSASVVNLPTGSAGKIFAIYDSSGNAVNNNITVTPYGGQTIDGAASYVIRTNRGAVILQFGTSEWHVIGEKVVTTEQNSTNLAIVDNTLGTDNTGVSVTNLQSSTFTFGGAYCQFAVEAGDKAMLIACDKNSNTVNALSDTESLFLATDSGTGVVVTKSSNVVTVKNRLGTSATFRIRVLAARVLSATAWS